MTKDYKTIMKECDKRIDYLDLPYLDNFYNSFGADTSTTKSMITKFFIEDLQGQNLNTIFNRLTAIPLTMCLKADYLPEELVIPSNIKQIGAWAFSGSENPKKVIFDCAITSIPQGAFSNMPNLEEVYIPEGVTQIVDGAFYGCPKLRLVGIPKSIQKIDINSFLECPELTSLQFEEESIDNLAKIMPDLKWVDSEPDEDGNVDQDLDESDLASAFYANAIEVI